jgi:hypothetical protein
MKVLDLQCENGHAFEGWFASEDDFLQQNQRAMVLCPLCASASVTKKLSAPRLNLGAGRAPETAQAQAVAESDPAQALAHAWVQMARRLIANTEDVGERFASEARKMHYGETEERAIRGKATPQETHALLEEGIEVLPLPLPESLKTPLQ